MWPSTCQCLPWQWLPCWRALVLEPFTGGECKEGVWRVCDGRVMGVWEACSNAYITYFVQCRVCWIQCRVTEGEN